MPKSQSRFEVANDVLSESSQSEVEVSKKRNGRRYINDDEDYKMYKGEKKKTKPPAVQDMEI